jgi:2-polyprenyl-3-methyl-5-hydroxy-6-metoxy-1,4-benzoquinol methylase
MTASETALDRQAHWNHIYTSKDEQAVSWFEAVPQVSLDLIHATGVGHDAAVIDIGGGASRLVDALLDEGFHDLTVLDISEESLKKSKARLGARGASMQWIVADVTTWQPERLYEVWHDRATLHFLTAPEERVAYVERLMRAVRPGGHVIIATFALEGPERCSGLPVVRHDAASLAALLGPSFELMEARRQDHTTPAGAVQRFQFSRFRRTD